MEDGVCTAHQKPDQCETDEDTISRLVDAGFTYLSTAVIQPGFADPVLCLPIRFIYLHPGLAVTTIEYRPPTFTISQVLRYAACGWVRKSLRLATG